MAESKFMAFLKNIFGCCAKEPQHERYCLTCHKMTAGTIASPSQAGQSGNTCVGFTCGECNHTTELLA